MKAVLISEPTMLDIIELPIPTIAVDEVLVRSRVVGLGESDVELYQGKRAKELACYPITPGHEWSGEIAAIGERVTGFQVGDRVAIDSFISCGVCRNCRSGSTNLCEVGYNQCGFTRAGGLAEYAALSPRQLYKVPSTASFEAVSLLEPAANVAHAFLRAQPRPGDVLAIVGDGPDSLLAAQFARLFSPAAVVVLGFRDERLQLAQQLGATHTINMSREDSLETVKALSQGRGADLVFEGTGHAQATEEAMMLARAGGTLLLEGMVTSHAPLSVESSLLVRKQLAIYGVFGANEAAWTYAVELFHAGTLHLSELISHRFALEDYQDALDTLILRQSRALKVVVEMP